MRKIRQLRLVLSFDTTAAALETERLAHEVGLAGRLIPTPRAVSAGCGLSWSAPPETGTALLELLHAHAVRCADTREILL